MADSPQARCRSLSVCCDASAAQQKFRDRVPLVVVVVVVVVIVIAVSTLRIRDYDSEYDHDKYLRQPRDLCTAALAAGGESSGRAPTEAGMYGIPGVVA